MNEGKIGGARKLGRSRVGSGLTEGDGGWAALKSRNSRDDAGDKLGGAGVDRSTGGGGIAMKDK
jgi:hypothetical protein